MTRPFRFGVSCSAAATPDALVDAAQRAEALGYSSVALPDHLDDQCGPLVGLTAAAAATTTINLTTLVLANDFRHPAVLAKELATLDQYCGGRLEWGMGAGWMASDYERSGIPLDRAGVRIARLAEAIAVMKRCFADGPFSFSGAHYTVEGLDSTPSPRQRPHPRLIVAGGGPKVLGLAAREADIVGINFGLQAGAIGASTGATGSPGATDAKLDAIRNEAGDRFDAIELQTRVHLVLPTDRRAETLQELAPGFELTPEEAAQTPHALVGTVDEMCDSIRGWRERWGISYVTWGLADMETMAPVVARLAGG